MDCNKGTKPHEESSKEEIEPVKRFQAISRLRVISAGE
jgi:hypothetical protein